jgi:hypothetical protein
MTKEFVPYELAFKLIYELGFKEKCLATIDQSGYLHIKGTKSSPRGSMLYDIVDCPTFSQAFRWFREEYGLQHDITLTADKELTGFYVLIHKLDGLVFNEDDAVELDIETTNREDVELIILNKMIEIVELKKQEQ